VPDWIDVILLECK